MRTTTKALAILVAAAGAAAGQSFNVNVSGGSGPAAAYGAAGLPGAWNNVPLVENVMYPLVGLGGGATSVSVRNVGGTALLSSNNPGTSGNDELLLDTYRATFNATETCLRFFNLQGGVYQIITYAWLPNDSLHTSRVACDESANPAQYVGGAWPGGFVLGTTHAMHIGSPINGEMNVHSGLSGGTATVAALNGIQLRLLTAWDGNVGLGSGGPFDLLTVNGSTGGVGRTVTLGIASPLTISLATAPGGLTPAPFLLFGTMGQPAPSASYTLPLGIGQSCFAPCTLAPATPGLFTLASTFGPDPCGVLFPASPAPWTVSVPAGPPFPFTCTLQGVIGQAPGTYAVCNALTVVFQ
jgi:hypothetical protein